MRLRFRLLVLLAVSAPVAGAAGQTQKAGRPVGAGPAVPMCKADDVSLSTDDENGAFNGMSHSGTLLVLRNLSSTACRVPQRPNITFLDKSNQPLPVTLDIPGAKFMHPGPVLVPVIVAPDAEVTAKLRWVSGEVYDQSVCVAPAAIVLTLERQTQQASMNAHICGEKAKGATYSATPLASDPV